MLIFKIAGLPDKNMFRIRFLPICASDSRCKIKRNFLIGDSDFSPSIHRTHGHKLAIYLAICSVQCVIALGHWKYKTNNKGSLPKQSQ